MQPWSQKWRKACEKLMGFDKTPAQERIADWWFKSDSRFTQILGGERAGKSWMAAQLALPCMDLSKEGEYWVVGPDYWQARPEWQYMYDALNKAGLVVESSMPVSASSPWMMKTSWGATIRTRSAADVQKLASFSVNGVIMAEAAQQVYESYLKLMGRVSETGGFMILSGTLEDGLPWYEDLFARWQGENVLQARSWSLPSWSNLYIYPGGREDPKIKELESEYPEDLFMMRFGALPVRKHGLVLPEFDMKTHVRHLEFVEEEPVELCIDPGTHCYAVLFVQFVGLKCHVLDRVYSRNKLAQEIIPEVMEHKLFPHVTGGTIDNAGKQHHANLSQVDLWKRIAGISLTGRYVPIATTINTLRFRFKDTNPLFEPLIYFDAHMTNAKSPDGQALDVLAEPELWKWPDRHQNRNQAMTPVDRNNDAMKALGYGLVHRYGGYVSRKAHRPTKKRSYWI